MFLETLESYDLTASDAVERLNAEWPREQRPREYDERRSSYAPERSYGGEKSYSYGGSSGRGGYSDRGGPERGGGYGYERERGYGGGGNGRYTPYGASPERGAYGRDSNRDYGPSRRDNRPDDRYNDAPYGGRMQQQQQQPQMIVLPQQALQTQSTMPTVLIQQADGTLVQAQVMTQGGGGYTTLQPQQVTTVMSTAPQPMYAAAPQPTYNIQYAPQPVAVAAAQQPIYSFEPAKQIDKQPQYVDAQPETQNPARFSPASATAMYSVAAVPATQTIQSYSTTVQPVPQQQQQQQQQQQTQHLSYAPQ